MISLMLIGELAFSAPDVMLCGINFVVVVSFILWLSQIPC